MKIKLLLKPISPYKRSNGDVVYDQVLLTEQDEHEDGLHPEGFVWGMVHIDCFWDREDKVLYEQLVVGGNVWVELTEIANG